jgi:hypothetical protein
MGIEEIRNKENNKLVKADITFLSDFYKKETGLVLKTSGCYCKHINIVKDRSKFFDWYDNRENI